MTDLRTLLAPLLAAFLVISPASAQHDGGGSPLPARTYSTSAIPPTDVEVWRDDLQALVDGIRRIHPDPYHKTSRAVFDDAVAALGDSIPGLPAHRIIVGFGRLVAMVGDGHTSLPLYFSRGVDFHVLPYRLGVHEEGVYIEAADRSLGALVGGRILSIGGVPVAEAMSRVTPLISRDNDNWIAAVAPNLLNRIEVLHALGLAPDLSGTEIAVTVDGRSVRRWASPLDLPQPAEFGLPFLPRYTDDWVDARDSAGRPVPLYQRRFDDLYWWEYLPEQDLLYIKWDQVQNRSGGPSALETFREALRFARERTPARTVIDIRNNTGGDGGLLPPVVREIIRTREVDEPGHLFLVIGRRTFSAGQMMTAMMQRLTSAVLVGERSSAFYNGYAGHEFLMLPHSAIGVMVSPDLYQMGDYPRDSRQQATPRLAAVPTFAAYAANRDPALEAILAWEPGRLGPDVVRALAAGDTAGAAALVQAYDARPENRFRDASVELNGVAYGLLRGGKAAEAVRVFELNVQVHPRYANGWDSLGEAYVAAGRKEDAIRAFRRALSIQPGLAPSVQWLRRLGEGGGGGS